MSPYGQYPPPQNPPPLPPPPGVHPATPWSAGPPPAPPKKSPVLAIVLSVVAAVVVLCGGALVVGLVLYQNSDSGATQQLDGSDGFTNYRQTNPEYLTNLHQPGPLSYPVNPPVGGDHNSIWQNCMGDVYTAEIAEEHAVHSLEHGAVWVTYRPDLPADQVEQLAARVRDVEYLFLSPYPGLDTPISLQAWGYQLKVDNAGDARIDEFIERYRINATTEPGAPCSGGLTEANPVPVDGPGMDR